VENSPQQEVPARAALWEGGGKKAGLVLAFQAFPVAGNGAVFSAGGRNSLPGA